MNRKNGYTLIEMMVVIAIFGIVLAGTSRMIVSVLTTHRQQSSIAETNIGGNIGVEMLRQDLEKAGYGVPWNGLPAYTEASTGVAAGLNDASNLPRGIMSDNGGGWNGTDYLVVRAANAARNSACNKWNFIAPDGGSTLWTSSTPTADNFADDDWVIVVAPGSPSMETTARKLAVSTSGSFFAKWSSAADLATTLTLTGIAYGIDDAGNTTGLARPFNRADYYVAQPASGMPQRCAPGTGILYKAIMKQDSAGSFYTALPLLDCVADLQVIFRWDQLGDGSLQPINDISGLTIQDLRDKVKEARVYILAQEGQKDVHYNYPANPPTCLGCDVGGSLGTPSFDFSGITDWRHYRWKIYTLVVKLDNLH